jgi:cysteinyl-tRNA synthetase
MALKLYNTLTRRKEAFRPLRPGVVKLYDCGPTVYNYAHIGNFRTYLFADLLRRYLESKGYRVEQVMNITDVGHMTVDDVADAQGEDKIERSARDEGKEPGQIADFYTEAFLRDWKLLNLLEPLARPKATGYVNEMIALAEALVRKGHAYEAGGSVYYHVPSFPGYGKLSGNTVEQLKAGAGGRVDYNREKRNQLDFALWVKNPRHIMQWDSPWGKGYPGWHIECSAMSMKLLGETLDIHTGGEDNIFPHHECEIAQSEAATGKTFVRYWMHASHLLVNGEKMAKSKGNFLRLSDVLEKGFAPEAVRFALLSAHYKTKLNLTEEGLRQAGENVRTLRNFAAGLQAVPPLSGAGADVKGMVGKAMKGFEKEMDDDLNIAGALPYVFGLVREGNRLMDERKLGRAGADRVLKALLDFDRVLGLGLADVGKVWRSPEEADEGVRRLILQREGHRKAKRWKEADRIRDSLLKEGYVLEDTPEGVRWKRAGL